MTNYANFRQRLDAVLRTLDVKQVSVFLIAEKQWSPGKPADAEFAMWMMIAGSPTLQDLHERVKWRLGLERRTAREQLVQDGAQAIDIDSGGELLLGPHLFGSHVARRADDGAGL